MSDNRIKSIPAIMESILLHLDNMALDLAAIRRAVMRTHHESAAEGINYETLSPDQEAWMDEGESIIDKDYKHSDAGRPVRCDHH